MIRNYSSQEELDDAFDDLEELYLEKYDLEVALEGQAESLDEAEASNRGVVMARQAYNEAFKALEDFRTRHPEV